MTRTPKKYDVGPDHAPMTVTEIAQHTGTGIDTIYARIKQGKTGIKLLTPKDPTKNQSPQKYKIGFNQPPMTLKEISQLTGLSVSTLQYRINQGYRGKRIVQEPMHANSATNYYNVGPDHPKMTIPEISKMTGVSATTLRRRIKAGVTGRALLKPVNRPSKQSKFYLEKRHFPATITEIAHLSGVSVSTIQKRSAAGLNGLELIADSNDPEKSQKLIKQLHSYNSLGRAAVQMLTLESLGFDYDALLAELIRKDQLKRKQTKPKYDAGPEHGMLTIKEMSELSGLSYATIYGRIKSHKTGADLIKPIVKKQSILLDVTPEIMAQVDAMLGTTRTDDTPD